MSSLEESQQSARGKLIFRTWVSLLLSTLIVGTVMVPSLYWLALWVPTLLFLNWRGWGVFLINRSFQCHFCRKLKEVKHLSLVDSLSRKEENKGIMCCDECASRLSLHVTEWSRVNKKVMEEAGVSSQRLVRPKMLSEYLDKHRPHMKRKRCSAIVHP